MMCARFRWILLLFFIYSARECSQNFSIEINKWSIDKFAIATTWNSQKCVMSGFEGGAHSILKSSYSHSHFDMVLCFSNFMLMLLLIIFNPLHLIEKKSYSRMTQLITWKLHDTPIDCYTNNERETGGNSWNMNKHYKRVWINATFQFFTTR